MSETYRNRTHHLIVAALIVLFGLVYSVSTTHAQVGSGPLHRDGVVRGTVRNEQGQPVGNLNVSLVLANSRDYYGSWTGKTKADGTYVIENIPYGEYHVLLSDYGRIYASEFLGGKQYAKDSEIISISNHVPHIVDATVRKGGEIRGTLVNDSGISIRRFSTSVYQYENDEWRYVQSGIENRDNNSFVIAGLTTGIYRVRVSGSYGNYSSFEVFYNDAKTIEDATDIIVTTGETITIQVASKIEIGSSISGKVTAAGTGWPLHDMEVGLYHLDHERGEWSRVRGTTTDSSGNYLFNNLDTDNYKVEFTQSSSHQYYAREYNGNQPTLGAAPHITLTDGDNIENVNAALEIGGVLQGTVTSTDGRPVNSVYVVAYRDNGAGDWLPTQYDYGRYDSNFWQLSGLPAGNYRVKITAQRFRGAAIERWYGNTTSFEQSPILQVSAEQTQRLPNLVLGDGVSISGTIRDTEWSRLADSQVTLYRLVNNDYWSAVSTTTTDSEGNYAFNGLAAGGYTLGASSSDKKYVTTYLGSKFSLGDAIGFRLDPNANRQGMNLFLPLAAKISGKVVMSDGSIPTSGSVTVTRADRQYMPGANYARLESDGSYVISGLPTGEYHVLFSASVRQGDSYRSGREYHLDAATRDEATTVTLTHGQSMIIDAEVGNRNALPRLKDASIQGQVLGSDGEPLEGIKVHLYYLATYRRARFWSDTALETTFTDANGNYSFPELYGNSYRLGFEDLSRVYEQQYYGPSMDFDTSPIFELESGEKITGLTSKLQKR